MTNFQFSIFNGLCFSLSLFVSFVWRIRETCIHGVRRDQQVSEGAARRDLPEDRQGSVRLRHGGTGVKAIDRAAAARGAVGPEL